MFTSRIRVGGNLFSPPFAVGFAGSQFSLLCYLNKFRNVLVRNIGGDIAARHQGKSPICAGRFHNLFTGALDEFNTALKHDLDRIDIAGKTHLAVQQFFCLGDICFVIHTDAACPCFGEQFNAVGGITAYM